MESELANYTGNKNISDLKIFKILTQEAAMLSYRYYYHEVDPRHEFLTVQTYVSYNETYFL